VRRAPIVVLGLVVSLVSAGCLSGRPGERAAAPKDALPPGWEDETPPESRLADRPFYDLSHSTSFVLKGHSYGRFVVRVPVELADVQVFFTTAEQYTGNGPKPTLDDPDAYHFEFMQIRPLGLEVVDRGVDAVANFAHAGTKGVYTLTYLYGKGTNYQFLAPYEGQGEHWRLVPGYYDVVVATDEKLTVGVNVKTGSPYWSTFYHPQELGTSQGKALGFRGGMWETTGGRLADERDDVRGIVDAGPGERLNYFTFADVWYETKGLALGTAGNATVTVNDDPVPHRLMVPEPGPWRAEAYAFAMGFNRPGPARIDLRSQTAFHEEASVQSTLVVMNFLFGVATAAEQAVPGLPSSPDL